jgi:hypothetical protein
LDTLAVKTVIVDGHGVADTAALFLGQEMKGLLDSLAMVSSTKD